MKKLLDDYVDTTKILTLTSNVSIPPQVELTGIKLFIRIEETRLPDTEDQRHDILVFTEDQYHDILSKGQINVNYIKSTAMTINNGLFLAESQFPDPISRNGVFAAQDISKNQVITFYEGRVVRDSDLPTDRRLLRLTRLFTGSATRSIPSWYILGDEVGGNLVSSDTPAIINSTGMGAGGFIKDCIDLERMIRNRAILGDGDDMTVENEKKIISEGSASGEEEEEDYDQFLSTGSYSDQFRPRVKDPEDDGATRSCINVALRVYDDRYNELIRDKVSSSTGNIDYLNLLDPSHTIVVVEALRTIRKGEELFMSYGDTLWGEYLGWFSPVKPPHTDIYKPTIDDQLKSKLAQVLRQKIPIIRPAYVEGVIDPYEPLDDEDDEGEEEGSMSSGEEEEEEWDDTSTKEKDIIKFAQDENVDDLTFYRRLLRNYDRIIADMETFSSNITHTRKEDLVEVKTLITSFRNQMKTASTTDQELEALGKLFAEIMVKANTVTSDDEATYYLAEQDINKSNKKDALLLKRLRKEIVALQIDDVRNERDPPSPEIDQLEEKRRLILVHHEIEPSKAGDEEKIVALFEQEKNRT